MTPTPNWFALVALLSWPIVALCLYIKRPVGQATLWTILGAQLLLPVGASFKFQGVPALDKASIANLAALIGCLLVVRRPRRIWTGLGFAGVLVSMSLIGPFITAELNLDPIFLGNKILPAESHYDAFSAIVRQFLALIPFFLGRQLLRNPIDSEEILRVLVIAGLVYSLPMLFEVRMSPQLHFWFYGYHPSDFDQEMRGGGFRPMVFMGHGLLAALFAMMTAVAAAAFWRTHTRVLRLPAAGVTAYLSVVLVLCKSLGALVYGVMMVPLVRFASPRIQFRVALILVTFALLYPLLRFADFIPTGAMVETASLVSVDRAESLKTRFENEDQLLKRASQRFLFGWGRYGRSFIYEQGSGRELSITDGRWIIVLGEFGLFGFLAEFGLLALPVFSAASALRFAESTLDRVNLAALALILGANIIDLLPNSGLLPWTWLFAGGLLGRAQTLREVAGRKHAKIRSYASVISRP